MTERTWWRPALDLAFVMAVALLALVPLQPAYGDAAFWLAAAGGVLVGGGAALLARRLQAGPAESAALALAGYFLFGGLFALRSSSIGGVLPTPRALADLGAGLVLSWKQLLTVSAPVSGFEQLLIVPYLAGLIVTALAAGLALRVRHWAWTLAPLGLLLVFSIAFGTYEGLQPALVGGGVAALGLGWAAWRRDRDRATAAQAELVAVPALGSGLRRLAWAAAFAVLAGVAGTATAGLLETPADRAVLRDVLAPPLELHDYPSPLMSFRKYSNDPDNPVLFTVAGLPEGTPVRLAAMDLYDGMVYKVSGSGGGGAGTFDRVGRRITGAQPGEPVTVQVEIGDLTGVWLPDAGQLTGLVFDGERADRLADGLHYNRATGTALSTSGVQPGDSYTFTAQLPAVPTSDQLQDAKLAQLRTPTPQLVSDAVVNLHAEEVDTAAPGLAQVRKIETFLRTGYFSHGTEVEHRSPSGHSNWRLTQMLSAQQLVGDQEQYAVTMALMAAQSGLPVRVVMGFLPEPQQVADGQPIPVRAKDVTAWVEVPVEGFGWVRFDPTPDEDRKPQQEVPDKRQKPVFDVPQPPPPPQEPVELPPAPPVEPEEPEDPGPDYSWLYRLAWIAGGTLAGLAVVLGPGLVMLALKRRRRLRRQGAERTADRISGGWDEVADAAADAGVRVPAVNTRREGGAQLAEAYPGLALDELATRADAAVFAPGDPSAEAAAAYWADVESARQRIARQASFGARVRRFFAPASLLRRKGR